MKLDRNSPVAIKHSINHSGGKMDLRLVHNRKWLCYLLMLALLALALPPRASWQCLNGAPCPPDCPMLRGGLAAVAARCAMPSSAADHCARCAMTSGAAGHCSRCAAAPVTSLTAQGVQVGVCATQQCVLRLHAQATASLTHKQIFTLPLLALPPPVYVAVAPVRTFAPFISIRPLSYLRSCLRPPSGRAPPFCMV
jgi:hypothetical protein